MELNNSIENLIKFSSAMFKMGFLKIYQGSLSAKIEQNKFIINNKEAVFDRLAISDIVLLNDKKDYRWNEASMDSDIHHNIYKNIPDARYVCYAMPTFSVAYSLNHDFVMPKDICGYSGFKKLKIYDPKQFDDWEDRAPSEVFRAMIEQDANILLVKGVGVYAYARDAFEIAKNIATLEESCKVLYYENSCE